MHVLIPFAFCQSDGCGKALADLKLPHLQKLLASLQPLALDAGQVWSLSAPHERALARVHGLPHRDGLIPWAALQAPEKTGAWGFVTLCHWQIGSHHIAMDSQALSDLSPADGLALYQAMQPFFAQDGIQLHRVTPTCWLARHDAWATLATAALDRVAGRHVDRWLPHQAQAASLRRLQSEMQMLLYTHPVNDARAQAGLRVVNSFWLHGTGALPTDWQAPPALDAPLMPQTLRDAAVAEDWPAWVQSWQDLDLAYLAPLLQLVEQAEGAIQGWVQNRTEKQAERNAERQIEQQIARKAQHPGLDNVATSPLLLTLCGEQHTQTYRWVPRGWRLRLKNRLNPLRVRAALERL